MSISLEGSKIFRVWVGSQITTLDQASCLSEGGFGRSHLCGKVQVRIMQASVSGRLWRRLMREAHGNGHVYGVRA